MVLFLDFDGTLHPMNRSHGVLSCLPRFEMFIRNYPHVDIVISSAWRTEYNLTHLKTYFSPDVAARIVGVIPNRFLEVGLEPHQRQKEIGDWLREEGREYESWVALDDAQWLFNPDCHRLVLVDPEKGFGETEEEKLRIIFNKKAP